MRAIWKHLSFLFNNNLLSLYLYRICTGLFTKIAQATQKHRLCEKLRRSVGCTCDKTSRMKDKHTHRHTHIHTHTHFTHTHTRTRTHTKHFTKNKLNKKYV